MPKPSMPHKADGHHKPPDAMTRGRGQLMTVEEAYEKSEAARRVQVRARGARSAVWVAPELERYVDATHYAGGARDALPPFLRSRVARSYCEPGSDRLDVQLSFLLLLPFLAAFLAFLVPFALLIGFMVRAYTPETDACTGFTASKTVWTALVCSMTLPVLVRVVWPAMWSVSPCFCEMQGRVQEIDEADMFFFVDALYLLYAQNWPVHAAGSPSAEPVHQIDIFEAADPQPPDVSHSGVHDLEVKTMTVWSDGTVTCDNHEFFD